MRSSHASLPGGSRPPSWGTRDHQTAKLSLPAIIFCILFFFFFLPSTAHFAVSAAHIYIIYLFHTILGEQIFLPGAPSSPPCSPQRPVAVGGRLLPGGRDAAQPHSSIRRAHTPRPTDYRRQPAGFVSTPPPLGEGEFSSLGSEPEIISIFLTCSQRVATLAFLANLHGYFFAMCCKANHLSRPF